MVRGDLVKGDTVMMSLRKNTVVALAVAGIAAGSFAVPAVAAGPRSFDAARLDKAPADYAQYRHRHWRGPSRGAAIAGAVGLGILGAAAIAAQNRTYAEPGYYYDYDDYYAPPPVYAYPRHYYAPYGYQSYDFRNDRQSGH
jgi:hypothetical protein